MNRPGDNGSSWCFGGPWCVPMLAIPFRSIQIVLLGQKADTLATVIAATVLAGELSLIGAQAAGHLIRSHMALNRKKH